LVVYQGKEVVVTPSRLEKRRVTARRPLTFNVPKEIGLLPEEVLVYREVEPE
jgi:hypothetical protein